MNLLFQKSNSGNIDLIWIRFGEIFIFICTVVGW